MNNLAIHPSTADALERLIAQPSHAVLLTGPKGIGKARLSTYLAERLLDLDSGKLADYAYARHIQSIDGKAISIEPVRSLEHFLSLVVPGQNPLRRVVIIEDAHLLGLEAQNALLKTLEEPPADTVIIMTATSPQSLLPTIQSRVQAITVHKPTKTDLQTCLKSDSFDVMYTVASGLPGLVHALITDQSHPVHTAVATARQLLGYSTYERLLQVDILAKDRELAQNTLAILQQMADISLRSATGAVAKRWQAILTSSYQAAEALSVSGNAKLVLTSLLMKL